MVKKPVTNEVHRDYLGNELHIGDTVVFMQLNYRCLMTGKIITMASKSALIEHEKTNVCKKAARQAYNQMIKLEGGKLPK